MASAILWKAFRSMAQGLKLYSLPRCRCVRCYRLHFCFFQVNVPFHSWPLHITPDSTLANLQLAYIFPLYWVLYSHYCLNFNIMIKALSAHCYLWSKRLTVGANFWTLAEQRTTWEFNFYAHLPLPLLILSSHSFCSRKERSLSAINIYESKAAMAQYTCGMVSLVEPKKKWGHLRKECT